LYFKTRWVDGEAATLAAYQAMLDVGAALNKAKSITRTTRAFGEWFEGQRFPFGVRWGNELARGAKVRAKTVKALKDQIVAGEPNLQKGDQDGRRQGASAS
jgi:hypothetical protein